MKKRMVIAILAAVAVATLFYAGRKLTIHALASIDLNVKPFVATITHYAVRDGVEIVTARETVARTRSGARVHTGTTYGPNGSTLNMRRIEAPDGFVAMIADSTKSKATGHRPDVTLASSKKQLLTQTANCVERVPAGRVNPEKLEAEEVKFGQRINRISVTQDTHRMTHWRMPDFNCQPVQILVEEKIDGRWQVKSGSILTSFLERDPDPDLFTGFTGYREMAPSSIVREYVKQRTGAELPSNQKTNDSLNVMDKNYDQFNK